MERDELVLPEAGWHLPGQREAAVSATVEGDVAVEATDMILSGSVANPNRLRLGVTPTV